MLYIFVIISKNITGEHGPLKLSCGSERFHSGGLHHRSQLRNSLGLLEMNPKGLTLLGGRLGP